MIHSQNEKSVVLLNPASYTNGATASGSVDTLGYNYCSIDVVLDSVAAATNNPDKFIISDGTTTVLSNATALTGGTGDTDFTIPNMLTNSANIIRVDVDLKAGKERFIHLEINPVTTQIIGAVARLSRAESTPDTNAELGAQEQVIL